MIMEGLETLVTPSHHAYLLTESAAAAHFNVLSFDTCSLFKTAASTASSYNLNNNNHSTANNNHHSHQQTQLLNSHHHHQQQQQQMQQPTLQSQHQQQSNTSENTPNSSNTSSHSATSVTQSKSDSTVVSSSSTSTTTSASGHHHPTLHIHETQQTVDRNVHQSQSGDLNTPVTTSGDVPSFFGPSTVVEPPIITGMNWFCLFYSNIVHLSSLWSNGILVTGKNRTNKSHSCLAPDLLSLHAQTRES